MSSIKLTNLDDLQTEMKSEIDLNYGDGVYKRPLYPSIPFESQLFVQRLNLHFLFTLSEITTTQVLCISPQEI